MTVHELTNKLLQQESLDQTESYQLFDAIIKGEVEPVVLSAVLTALKIKGKPQVK